MIVFMCFSSCICCQNPYSYPVDNFNSYSPVVNLTLIQSCHIGHIFLIILTHITFVYFFENCCCKLIFTLVKDKSYIYPVDNFNSYSPYLQSCHIGQGQIILIVFMCFSSCICCQNPYSYPVDNFNSYSPYLRILFSCVLSKSL